MEDQRGFSLFEAILVIALVGIVAAVFATALVPTMRASVMVGTRNEALQSARVALDRMVREIRLIRSTAYIQTWTANDLKFNVNNPYNTSIEFKLSGDTPPNLLRVKDGVLPGDVLSGNVQSLTFSYLENNGNPAALANIWRIVIDLSVKVGAETVNLRSEVHPSNF